MIDPTTLHKALEDAGYDVVSVDQDGKMEFATTKTDDEVLAIRKFVLEFKEPTRAEISAELLRNRDVLLDRMLLERFMPQEKINVI